VHLNALNPLPFVNPQIYYKNQCDFPDFSRMEIWKVFTIHRFSRQV